MSNVKAPQHDLYESIGKITIDGRTKAYKDVVARLQNAAEIRQQRKDAAALSLGNADGHEGTDVEEGIVGTLATGAATGAMGAIGSYAGSKASAAGEKKLRKTKKGKEVLKKLDMGEDIEERVLEILGERDIDESPAAIKGIKMGGRLIKKGASKLRNPATRSMGKKTIGHGAKTAGKGIAKTSAAAGKGIAKTVSKTSAAKNISKGIKKVAPKTALGRDMAKGAAKGAAVGGAAGAAVNKARHGHYTGTKKRNWIGKKRPAVAAKTESLEIEEAIASRVAELLRDRGIDESAKDVVIPSGRYTNKEQAAAKARAKANRGKRADSRKKNNEGLAGAAALVGAGVALGRKSKERKVKVQKGRTQWDDAE